MDPYQVHQAGVGVDCQGRHGKLQVEVSEQLVQLGVHCVLGVLRIGQGEVSLLCMLHARWQTEAHWCERSWGITCT